MVINSINFHFPLAAGISPWHCSALIIMATLNLCEGREMKCVWKNLTKKIKKERKCTFKTIIVNEQRLLMTMNIFVAKFLALIF